MWARMPTNLFTDVNSNMMRANKEKWNSCNFVTSLKMPDNSINAKLQYRRIHLSSARSNDHLDEPNVHMIALQKQHPCVWFNIEPWFYQCLSSTDRSFPFFKFHAHMAYLMFVVVKNLCLTTIFNSIINSPLCQLKGETTRGFMNLLHWNFELPP